MYVCIYILYLIGALDNTPSPAIKSFPIKSP